MLRRLAAALSGRKYIGADALGNTYFERPHPKYSGRMLRELVPPAGQDPMDYSPDQVPGEWAHWLQGGGDEDGRPVDPVVIEAAEEQEPSGPLSRPGTGLFEQAPSQGFQPGGWQPGAVAEPATSAEPRYSYDPTTGAATIKPAAAPAPREGQPLAEFDVLEAEQRVRRGASSRDSDSPPGTGEDAPSQGFQPRGWRPGSAADQTPTEAAEVARRPGTGVFEESSGKPFQPSGWRPS